MKTHGLIGLALCTIACAGSAADDDEEQSTQPTECDPAEQVGTYLMQLDLRDGNCGEFSDRLVRVDALAEDPDGLCVEDAPERWTEGGCKVEASVTCDDAAGRGTYQNILVLTQRDESGDRFTGILSVAAWDTMGAQVCRGTYDVAATRQ